MKPANPTGGTRAAAETRHLDAGRTATASAVLPVRRHRDHPAPRPWLLALGAWLAASTLVAHAQAFLPAVGGSGGGQFTAPCAQGQLLAGFELRVGDDVDAIRPLCAAATAPGQPGAPLGSAGQWHGGEGGEMQRLVCPAKAPVVIGIDVASEGVTEVVNNIHLFCGSVARGEGTGAYPSAILDAPEYAGTVGVLGKFASRSRGSLRCPPDQVGVGLHGRSGKWLDAMGLICDVPAIAKAPVALGRVPDSKPPVALGRVKTGRALESAVVTSPHAVRPPAEVTRPSLDPPICSNARQARARNSPAAPALEAQCRAAGGPP